MGRYSNEYLEQLIEDDTSPVWSPDRSSIVFGSTRDGRGIFKIAADGTGGVERLAGSVTGTVPLPHVWSPDGQRFLMIKPGTGDPETRCLHRRSSSFRIGSKT